MPTLVILVGLPGCGKSTWADNLLANNFHYAKVSSDAIREELGDITDQTQNDLVFKLFHEYIGERLMHNMDVVADSTGLTRRARENMYTTAEKYGAKVHVIFFINAAQAFARNEQRERVVPQDAMRRMLEQYERARAEIIQESARYESLTYINGVS